jgi:hypothetical protein
LNLHSDFVFDKTQFIVSSKMEESVMSKSKDVKRDEKKKPVKSAKEKKEAKKMKKAAKAGL